MKYTYIVCHRPLYMIICVRISEKDFFRSCIMSPYLTLLIIIYDTSLTCNDSPEFQYPSCIVISKSFDREVTHARW